MKFLAAFATLAGLVAAVPTTPTEDLPLDARAIEKRATITDAADVGYATQNGGTTGGKGGTTTTVSTLAQFTAAAGSSSSYVIVVSGAISGAAKVKVTSNKTIVGKSGSSEYPNYLQPRSRKIADPMYRPYWYWSYHQWTVQRHCPQLEDFQGPGRLW